MFTRLTSRISGVNLLNVEEAFSDSFIESESDTRVVGNQPYINLASTLRCCYCSRTVAK